MAGPHVYAVQSALHTNNPFFYIKISGVFYEAERINGRNWIYKRLIQQQNLAHKKRTPVKTDVLLPYLKIGGDLLSHFYAVPSALQGLTSLIGTGRGGAPAL
jgi:hypothetical protein